MHNPTAEGKSSRSHRESRSLLTRVATPLVSLRGGPRFDDCVHRHVDCGPFNIEFFQPRAYFGSGRSPATIDLSSDTTFDDIAYGDRTKHAYVRIAGSNWNYSRPHFDLTRYLPIPHEPYVIITAIWRLERVKHGITLDVGNDDTLEGYLRQDYDEFLELEGEANWKIRKFCQEKFGEWDDPEFMKARLAARLLSPPLEYERITFNGLSWLRYVWRPRPKQRPEALVYSRVVASRTILTFYLNAVHMDGGQRADARWWKALIEDSEDLMSGLTITDKALPSA